MNQNGGPPLELLLQGFANQGALPGYLRISLLEQCNQRCFFCHNEGQDTRRSILDERLLWKAVDAAATLGKRKYKLTGGEPTIHPRLVWYVRELRRRVPDAQIGIITNGTLLKPLARLLRDAGLDRVTVSLHSLSRDTYQHIAQHDGLTDALAGLDAVDAAGFEGTGLNMLVCTINRSEVPAIVSFAAARGYELRLLDMLPSRPEVASRAITRANLLESFPGVAVKAKRFHPKCRDCGSSSSCGEEEYLRLLADGCLAPCLFRTDLRIQLSPADSDVTSQQKLALGFRRIWYDDL